MPMNLGLGTVEFAMRYGVNNQQGKPSFTEVKNILLTAKQNAIQLIDTACEYHNAHKLIAKCLPTNHDFLIVSKLPAIASLTTGHVIDEMKNLFIHALADLHQTSIYGILLHCATDLLGEYGDKLFRLLMQFKNEGRVNKIGISVYSAKQVQTLVSRYPLDIVQLPINIFNQDMLAFGILTYLKKQNIEIHARSIFLQGLLLMEAKDVQVELQAHMLAYQAWLQARNLTPLQAAMGFIKQLNTIDYAIVGVNNTKELQEIIHCKPIESYDYTKFALHQSPLVDPRQWQISV